VQLNRFCISSITVVRLDSNSSIGDDRVIQDKREGKVLELYQTTPIQKYNNKSIYRAFAMLLNKVSAVQLRKLMNGKELPRRRELIRRIAALVVSGILSRNETTI
jgi:hypothetical protein